jgi:hypothetical protein
LSGNLLDAFVGSLRRWFDRHFKLGAALLHRIGTLTQDRLIGILLHNLPAGLADFAEDELLASVIHIHLGCRRAQACIKGIVELRPQRLLRITLIELDGL